MLALVSTKRIRSRYAVDAFVEHGKASFGVNKICAKKTKTAFWSHLAQLGVI